MVLSVVVCLLSIFRNISMASLLDVTLLITISLLPFFSLRLHRLGYVAMYESMLLKASLW